MSDDWYRQTSWNEAEQHEFFARLKRARKANRPQYLRIQATHLAEAGLHQDSIQLLDRFMQIDDGSIDLAAAWLLYAESSIALGHDEKAIKAFRACLRAERARPNVQTEAWLLFPWFLVACKRSELHAEAQSVLDEFEDVRSRSFPISNYRYHCVRALLSAEAGDQVSARYHARLALESASANDSGYRYHTTAGLVRDVQTDVHARVSTLAKA